MSKPIVKDLKVFLDDRGYLFEILRSDDPHYSGFGQSYVSTTNPGSIKGFHIHKRKIDYITCVSGQVKFVMVEEGTGVVQEVHLGGMCPRLVVVPPGWWHGWMCVGTAPAVLVNCTTEPFNPNDKDEERLDPIDNPWGYKWCIKHG
jgi:dTDP-4-dehydrorhamnose 3,5-epimerase